MTKLNDESMKRIITILPVSLFSTFLMYGYEVSTTIEKKNILMEEFTGINCGNCPQGHAVAKMLGEARPDNAYLVAIHAGYYARPQSDQPDYRIAEGEAINNEFLVTSYPCAIINRHVFSGSSEQLPRSKWIKSSKEINTDQAPVNLHITSEYDHSTRELQVYVEGYYTLENNDEFNQLSVIFTQNNIQGYQSGSGVGYEYMHQHMLRDFITPTWGDTIVAPRQGEYFTRAYTYQLPEKIGSADVDPSQIEVIAFVSKDKREILNVTGCAPVLKNIELDNKVEITNPLLPIGTRYGFNFFEVKLHNKFNQPLTSAEFDITVNGDTQRVAWAGNVKANSSLLTSVKVDSYEIKEGNDYEIKIVKANGLDIEPSSISGSFAAPLDAMEMLKFKFQTDLYADENRYIIKDADGTVVREFGPYTAGIKNIVEESITLEPNTIYCLEIADAWGDGIQEPKGYMKVYNAEDNSLVDQNLSIAGHGARSFFRTNIKSAIDAVETGENLNIIYDKSSGCIVVTAETAVYAEIYNITGYRVNSVSGESGRADIAVYGKGIYIVKAVSGDITTTKKIIIE